MKRLAKRVFGLPVALLVAALIRLSNRRVGIVVAYHRVGDPQGDPARELVPALATGLFESHLRHLARWYDVVPASRLLLAVRVRARGKRIPVAITFDDDLRSHVDVALPILSRLRLPAAFFLSGAGLAEPIAFWWERLQSLADRGVDVARHLELGEAAQTGDIHSVAAEIEAMEPSERDAVADRLLEAIGTDPPDSGLRASDVALLVSAGHHIGFHTRRHDPLPELDDVALARALEEGRAELAEAAGESPMMIAYPHGQADDRVADAARRAGYDLGFTCEPEVVTTSSDPLLLGRVEPWFGSTGDFALQLAKALVRGARQR